MSYANNMLQQAFAAGMMNGQLWGQRQNDRKNRLALKDYLTQICVMGATSDPNTSNSNTSVADKLSDPTVAISGNTVGNSNLDDPMEKELARQDDFKSRINNILHPEAKYNANNVNADVDLGSLYLNRINSAKLKYAIAEKVGDVNGMYAANADAEQARADAKANNVALPEAGQSATSGTYVDLQNEMDAIRKAQAIRNTNDFATGQGKYAYNDPTSKTEQDFINVTGAYAQYNPYQLNPNTSVNPLGSSPTVTTANASASPSVGDGLTQIAQQANTPASNVATLNGNTPVALASPNGNTNNYNLAEGLNAYNSQKKNRIFPNLMLS